MQSDPSSVRPTTDCGGPLADGQLVGEQLVNVPRHVAIIMDGNGRWARQRGLHRLAGHRAGVENVRKVLTTCVEFGIEYLTIYAFSTENWNRPAEEVQGLFELVRQVICDETPELLRNGVQVRHVGRLDELPDGLAQAILDAVALTRHNGRIVLNVAFNYGGRAEIVDAVRALVAAGIDPTKLTEQQISQFLYTAGQPDPDLIIRTGGEMRLSNFLIWQAAYAEYFSTPVFWPDFGREELYTALLAYQRRERRFGRVFDGAPRQETADARRPHPSPLSHGERPSPLAPLPRGE
ncbi:MAG: di-trans,poly-cis-decaprenylcistransferase, partial [Chloroflexi bacterium]|nr:di-trans,poly-cis-decaprenylcistransferase [Chloroflexota bacterium]